LIFISYISYSQVYLHNAYDFDSSGNPFKPLIAGQSITTGKTGDYYITGSFVDTANFNFASNNNPLILNSYNWRDAFVVKYDKLTNYPIWAYQIGGYNSNGWLANSIAVSTAETSTNEMYIAGNYKYTIDCDQSSNTFNLTSSGNNDVFICKISSSGVSTSFVWAKSIGGIEDDNVKSIAVDKNDNIYIIGTFSGNVDFNADPNISYNLFSQKNSTFICKYSSNGNFLWAKNFSPTSYLGECKAESIKIDRSGNIYSLGYFSDMVDFDPGNNTFNITALNNDQAFICKLNSSGNFLWAQSIEAATGNVKFNIDSLDNVIIAGNYNGNPDFDAGSGVVNLTPIYNQTAFFILKIDSNGNFMWVKGMGAGASNNCKEVQTDKYNNIYLLGFFGSNSSSSFLTDFDPNNGVYNLTPEGLTDIFILKIDSAGNFVWARNFGNQESSNHEYSNSFCINDSIIYIIGRYRGLLDVGINPGETQTLNFPSNITTNMFISIWAQDISTGIADNLNSFQIDISIFPNPSSGQFTFNNLQKESVIEIYDITGRLIFNTTTLNTSETIDLSDKQKGVYFYKIISDKNEIQQGKIIIQ